MKKVGKTSSKVIKPKNRLNLSRKKSSKENALNLKASDVHIEPREDSLRWFVSEFTVRFGISEKLQKDHAKKLAKHFKSVGGLDFSEKVFAQSMSFKHGNCRIRASISPTFWAKKLLRLLSAKSRVRSLEEIGLFGDNLRKFVKRFVN